MINKVSLIRIPRDHVNGYSNRFITFNVYMRWHLKSIGIKFTNFSFIFHNLIISVLNEYNGHTEHASTNNSNTLT